MLFLQYCRFFFYISRNKSGIWGWRSDRSETVNTHESKVRPLKKKDIMTFDNLKEKSVLETKGIMDYNWLKFD